jgi:hypothetical protein
MKKLSCLALMLLAGCGGNDKDTGGQIILPAPNNEPNLEISSIVNAVENTAINIPYVKTDTDNDDVILSIEYNGNLLDISDLEGSLEVSIGEVTIDIEESFIVNITDGTDNVQYEITINISDNGGESTNTPPTLDIETSIIINENETLDIPYKITDADENNVTLLYSYSGNNITIEKLDGIFRIHAKDVESDTIETIDLLASDGIQETSSQLTVTIKNRTPVDSITNLPSNRSLGVNVTGVNYWATQYSTIDIMKQSSPWIPRCETGSCDESWDTGEFDFIELDDNGWPLKIPLVEDKELFNIVTTIVFDSNSHPRKENRYYVLYDGEGTVSYTMTGSKNEDLSTTGMDVLDLTETNWLAINIHSTNPDNHLRNIRIIPEGGICDTQDSYAQSIDLCNGTFTHFLDNYNTQIFHPMLLSDLKSFRSIRFMDWFNTVGNPMKEWSERTLPEHRTWMNKNGAPIETAILLGQLLNSEIWINIPVQVNDDFVTNYARFLKNKTTKNIYIEYGNEVWNSAYPFNIDGNYITEQAINAWGETNGDTPEHELKHNWYAKRTIEICDVFEEIIGEEQVVCTINTQAANSWIADYTIRCPIFSENNPLIDNCSSGIDAIAIAPYFAGYLGRVEYMDTLKLWKTEGTLESNIRKELIGKDEFNVASIAPLSLIYSDTPNDGAVSEIVTHISENKIVSELYNKRLLSYEGGQHIVGLGEALNDAVMTEIYTDINRYSVMGDAYNESLVHWREQGGELFHHWLGVQGYSKFGSWGMKENQWDNESFKFNALKDFSLNITCWWENCQ